jgi:hypothetical protein
LYAKEATQHLVKGDHFAALPWLVRALQLEQGNPRSEPVHRARVAAVLQECPRPVGIYSVPDASVLGADINADGRMLATGHEDDQVRLWEVPTGRLLQALPHAFPVHHCRFLASQDLLLTCAFGQQAHIWNLETQPAASLTLPHWVTSLVQRRYESGFDRKAHEVYLVKADFSSALLQPLHDRLGQLEGLTLRVAYIADAASVRVRQEVRKQSPPRAVLVADEFLDTPGPDPLAAGYETGDTAPLRGRVWLFLWGAIEVGAD